MDDTIRCNAHMTVLYICAFVNETRTRRSAQRFNRLSISRMMDYANFITKFFFLGTVKVVMVGMMAVESSKMHYCICRMLRVMDQIV